MKRTKIALSIILILTAITILSAQRVTNQLNQRTAAETEKEIQPVKTNEKHSETKTSEPEVRVQTRQQTRTQTNRTETAPAPKSEEPVSQQTRTNVNRQTTQTSGQSGSGSAQRVQEEERTTSRNTQTQTDRNPTPSVREEQQPVIRNTPTPVTTRTPALTDRNKETVTNRIERSHNEQITKPVTRRPAQPYRESNPEPEVKPTRETPSTNTNSRQSNADREAAARDAIIRDSQNRQLQQEREQQNRSTNESASRAERELAAREDIQRSLNNSTLKSEKDTSPRSVNNKVTEPHSDRISPPANTIQPATSTGNPRQTDFSEQMRFNNAQQTGDLSDSRPGKPYENDPLDLDNFRHYNPENDGGYTDFDSPPKHGYGWGGFSNNYGSNWNHNRHHWRRHPHHYRWWVGHRPRPSWYWYHNNYWWDIHFAYLGWNWSYPRYGWNVTHTYYTFSYIDYADSYYWYPPHYWFVYPSVSFYYSNYDRIQVLEGYIVANDWDFNPDSHLGITYENMSGASPNIHHYTTDCPDDGYGIIIRRSDGSYGFYHFNRNGNRLAQRIIDRHHRYGKRTYVEVRGYINHDTHTITVTSMERLRWLRGTQLAVVYQPRWLRFGFWYRR